MADWLDAECLSELAEPDLEVKFPRLSIPSCLKVRSEILANKAKESSQYTNAAPASAWFARANDANLGRVHIAAAKPGDRDRTGQHYRWRVA